VLPAKQAVASASGDGAIKLGFHFAGMNNEFEDARQQTLPLQLATPGSAGA